MAIRNHIFDITRSPIIDTDQSGTPVYLCQGCGKCKKVTYVEIQNGNRHILAILCDECIMKTKTPDPEWESDVWRAIRKLYLPYFIEWMNS